MGVVIIDYGSGNLRSAGKAFERAAADLGLEVLVSGQPEDLIAASHIVLPGVGSFADCKQGLISLPGMVEALCQAVIFEAKPFLGICVGMQLLADLGFEHGQHKGLAWIEGEVSALARSDKNLKIPHMGWNDLQIRASDHPFFTGVQEGSDVYFVHSYEFKCVNPDDCLASVDYGGPIAAVIGRENVIGTQFHPEKSQATGLKLITNFLKWRP